MKNIFASAVACILFTHGSTYAQDTSSRTWRNINYSAELAVDGGSDKSPLWLNANRHGVSSVKGNSGYLRAAIFHETAADSARNWRIGYGADLVAAYDFTNSFTVQQLYADVEYKKVRLSIGSKERPMELKNQELSSGSFTFGINSRPVPQVRIELPDYINISGKSNWVGIKGHFAYGMMTDGRWQEDYVNPGIRYAKGALYHSKAGFLRIGNEEKFPLTLEGGLEMACEFGGTIYNPLGFDGVFSESIKMGSGLSDFWDAIFAKGSDQTDGDGYANAAGNTVGSWLLSLTYKGRGWKVRAYYDHFFEDHSQLFMQYGWKDGLIGAELTLPRNRAVSTAVYEYVNTTYQSGPVYHDHTAEIPDQISGVDNYYNHNLYQGWQHWGQAIGNPLILSPLYNANGDLTFSGNRIKAHHFGLNGDPTDFIHYRLLYTYMTGWGTYAAPYSSRRHSNSLLCELNFAPKRIARLNTAGWQIGAAFALDRGTGIGSNTGFRISLRKTGLLTK